MMGIGFYVWYFYFTFVSVCFWSILQPSDGTGSDWRDTIAVGGVANNGGVAARSSVGGGSGAVVSGIIMADTNVTDGVDVPPPYSDTTESEDERYMSDEAVQCPVLHEGREMLNMVMPMSVDELFTLLFTNSSFYIDFIQTTRKCTG